MQYCKNHSTKIAKHRCFQCKMSICLECRLSLAHHFFCSYNCYIKFKTKQISKQLKKHQIKIIYGFQLILLGLFLFHILDSDKSMDTMNIDVQNKSLRDSATFSFIQEYLKIHSSDFENDLIKKVGVKDQHQYLVKLPLKKDWVVNIWRNEQPIIAAFTQDNAEELYHIPLHYGINIIKVLVLNQKQEVVYQDKFMVEYKNSRVEMLRQSIEEGNVENKRLAITFDAGSDSSYTEKILEILEKHNLSCTMFLTGKFIEKHPNLVKKMVKQGHEFANHTYDHPHLTNYRNNHRQELLKSTTRDFIHQQLYKTDSLFFKITGQHLKPFWRAPFGEYNTEILTWAAEAGYVHIKWTDTFDTHDWVTDEESELYHTPGEIFDHFMQAEEERPFGLNGVIVLMHLGSDRNGDHIFEVLPILIQTVQEKGYTLGCISDLLRN